MEAKDAVTPRSSLHDDLGMDEVDLIEVMFRAEERFGLVLPDNGIGLSSTVSDIVDLIAARAEGARSTVEVAASDQRGAGKRAGGGAG